MNDTLFWTPSGARLRCVHSHGDASCNWLFLPGGPGLGSESLAGLIDLLRLPGKLWAVDFPGDGSNISANFSDWQPALIEAVQALNQVILVAHSSGGMFALATPALEAHLSGLILMDSAPDASWQQAFMQYVQTHPLPDLERLQKNHLEKPSNHSLKALTLACLPWFSTEKGQDSTLKLFQSLPFNSQSHQWAERHFDPIYQSKWVPEHIPTLIFAGAQDQITPLNLFQTAPAFQRDNIHIRTIPQAAHFPWIDNPAAVQALFDDYCLRLGL